MKVTKYRLLVDCGSYKRGALFTNTPDGWQEEDGGSAYKWMEILLDALHDNDQWFEPIQPEEKPQAKILVNDENSGWVGIKFPMRHSAVWVRDSDMDALRDYLLSFEADAVQASLEGATYKTERKSE